MNNKVIFFDFDGTIYSHKTNSIPKSTFEAFELLKQNGIKLVLATGRHKLELEEFKEINYLHFDAYITLNGAYIYDNEQVVISDTPIDKIDLTYSFEYTYKYNLPIQVLEANQTYITTINDLVINSQNKIHTTIPPLGKSQLMLKNNVYQLVVFGKKDELENYTKNLKKSQILYWNENDAIDVMHKDVGKNFGIDIVCDKWNIDISNTIAFGDGQNDIEMIEHANLGIAMGNSDKKLISIANEVTDDVDNDGIYKALKNYKFI